MVPNGESYPVSVAGSSKYFITEMFLCIAQEHSSMYGLRFGSGASYPDSNVRSSKSWEQVP